MAVLRRFAEAYCREHHAAEPRRNVCRRCEELLDYAWNRLGHCPHDPKPMCKDCATQCYAEPYRSRMQRMMRFAVRHFLGRGRIDILLRGLKISGSKRSDKT